MTFFWTEDFGRHEGLVLTLYGLRRWGERGVWFRSPLDFLLLFFVFVPPSLHFVAFHKILFTFGQNLARWYIVFSPSYWPDLKPFFWKKMQFLVKSLSTEKSKRKQILDFSLLRMQMSISRKSADFGKKSWHQQNMATPEVESHVSLILLSSFIFKASLITSA